MDDASADAEGNQLYAVVGVIAVGFLILIVAIVVGWLILRDPVTPECTSDSDCDLYTCNATTQTCRTSCSSSSDCNALSSCNRGVCRANADTASRVTPTPRTCGNYSYDLGNLRCFTSCRFDRQCVGGFHCLGNACVSDTTVDVPSSVLPPVPETPILDTGGGDVPPDSEDDGLGLDGSIFGGFSRARTNTFMATPTRRARTTTAAVRAPTTDTPVVQQNSAILDLDQGAGYAQPIADGPDLLSIDNPAGPIFNSDLISGTFGTSDRFFDGAFHGVGQTFATTDAEPRNYGPIRSLNPGMAQRSRGLGFSSMEGPTALNFRASIPRAKAVCSLSAEPVADNSTGLDDFAALLQ